MSYKTFAKALGKWYWHNRTWVLTYRRFLDMGVEHGILKPMPYDPAVHGKRQRCEDDCNPVAIAWTKEAKPGDRVYVIADEENE